MSAPLPSERSPDNVDADVGTLIDELFVVADRHDGDLSHAEIVRTVLTWADAYGHRRGVSRAVPGDGPTVTVTVDGEAIAIGVETCSECADTGGHE